VSKLRIAVVGATGRLGARAAECYGGHASFELVARIGRGHDLRSALREARPEVALDATEAGLGARHARIMLENGVRPLVGTSGVSDVELAELDALARGLGLGGLVVPNFSLGMVLLQRAALEFARHMPQVEIIELHHERKKDAPSGTAIDTANKLRADRPGRGEIPIHSVRLPGHYAHQEVVFGAPGERLTLRHDMSSPEAFGPGLLAAARHAARAVGVARGLEHALAP
jgi:4-hydroxy-tetrahydrodipicolinate reductase